MKITNSKKAIQYLSSQLTVFCEEERKALFRQIFALLYICVKFIY